ncbi:Uncharacterized protein HZ326_18809, partial [Fusarium oxysporum f. sp. albedinis]
MTLWSDVTHSKYTSCQHQSPYPTISWLDLKENSSVNACHAVTYRVLASMASQASEISVSWTNNTSIGSFASKLSWNFNAFFYIDYPDEYLQVELGPKRRKTKGHRAYVCLHCQNPPWSNRVPGNAIRHAETAHRALIRASEAANDTPSSTFASG